MIIKSVTGHTLYASEHETIKAALEAAVNDEVNLFGAYLVRANLSGINLPGVNLSGVTFARAHLDGANLSFAYLAGVNFSGVDLTGANLTRATLTRTYLVGANLAGANLTEVNFAGADLGNADFTGATLSWKSHHLLSEILHRAADTEPRRMLAGFVRISTDWCWDQWAQWEHPEKAWALAELAKWVQAGDGAPGIVRAAAEGMGTETKDE